jgi:hypothetical protein
LQRRTFASHVPRFTAADAGFFISLLVNNAVKQ